MTSRSKKLPKQLALELADPRRRPEKRALKKEHGGEVHAKRRERKEERPFNPAKSLHVTMRSTYAVGERSMLHPSRSRVIRRIVFSAAGRHGIILQRYVCVGNHLHFLIRTKSHRMRQARPALRAFLREVAGLVARVVTGAKKGTPSGIDRPFWDHLAWSRIVEWGRDLVILKKYIEKNIQEFLFILFENGWPTPELPP